MGAGKGEMDVVSAQKSRNVKTFPAEIKIFVQLAFKVRRHAVKVNAPDTGFGFFECVNPFGNELIILYGCDKAFTVFFGKFGYFSFLQVFWHKRISKSVGHEGQD